MRTIKLLATPVVAKDNAPSANQGSTAPAVFVSDTPVNSIGAVDNRPAMNGAYKSVPNDITVVFDNSASASPATYVLGDANGLIQAILGVTYLKPTVPQSGYDALVKAIGNNPRTYKSLNYRIITGTSGQFSQAFKYADSDEDGTLLLKPVNMPSAQRNTQQNDKILTIAQDIPMDDTTALILTVAANTRVEIDLSMREIFRPGGAN